MDCILSSLAAAEVVHGSSAWIGRGLSCVCAQRRDSDARLSFDLTPSQVIMHCKLGYSFYSSMLYLSD